MTSLVDQLEALIDAGLTFGEVVNAFSQRQDAYEKAVAERARDQYTDEGTLEIDENAIVSVGDDDGAYVMAWVWVYIDPDAPVPGCTVCSFTYQHTGGQETQCLAHRRGRNT